MLIPCIIAILLSNSEWRHWISASPHGAVILKLGWFPPWGFSSLGWFTDWWRHKVRTSPKQIAATHDIHSRCQHLEVRVFRVYTLHIHVVPAVKYWIRLLRSSVCDITGRLPSGQIMRHISKLCKFLKFFFQLCFSNLPYSNYLRMYIIYPCPQTVLTKQSKHFVTHTKLKRNLYPKRSCW